MAKSISKRGVGRPVNSTLAGALVARVLYREARRRRAPGDVLQMPYSQLRAALDKHLLARPEDAPWHRAESGSASLNDKAFFRWVQSARKAGLVHTHFSGPWMKDRAGQLVRGQGMAELTPAGLELARAEAERRSRAPRAA